MNLELHRNRIGKDGVFGELFDHNGIHLCFTLEHNFDGAPKLPAGEYTCQRGTHRLHDNIPFVTFEVKGVPGHTGILFHQGNYNCDSDGCILLGLAFRPMVADPKSIMLTHSRDALKKFLQVQNGLAEFQLTVHDQA